jgi:hypothetical protein
MIDLGVSKLALIAVVALVVIGPERLPKVARMAGNLLGRAQRYMAEVKSEVNRLPLVMTLITTMVCANPKQICAKVAIVGVLRKQRCLSGTSAILG